MNWQNWDSYDTFFTIVFILAGIYFFAMITQSAETFAMVLPVVIQLIVGIAWVIKYINTRDRQP